MNVIASANSKYMRYLYVMLLSLFENNKEETVTVFVMQRDFTDEDKESILRLGTKFGQKVEFLFVDQSKFLGLPTDSKFSLETYFRLMMSELLPAQIDKILYLDVDIIVRGSLREFYATDIFGHLAAVCRDMDHPVLEEKKRELFHRVGDMRYFNAGVMLWNVSRLKKEYSLARFMEAAKELEFQLQYADQEILNYLLYDKVLYRETHQYNYIVRGEVRESDLSGADAAILHYAGCNPWQNGRKNDLYRIWWDYAKKTPFYMALLEESLWREIGFGAEKEANCLRDMESREIYEWAFRLKGEGRIRQSLHCADMRLGIYGAGVMAEVLYKLLAGEDAGGSIRYVVDRAKTGDFHGIPITSEIPVEEGLLWIVTPVYRSQELLNEVRRLLGDAGKAISLREWLKNIV